MVVNTLIRGFLSLMSSGGFLQKTAAVAIVAYVGLAGESIHCRYFNATHGESDHHSGVPTGSKDAQEHVVHCLVANHSGSIAVETHTSHLQPPLAVSDRLATDEHLGPSAKFRQLTPARAPPFS
jgi:hypothetical protein